MRRNRIKQHLAAGATVTGIIVFSASAVVIEAAAAAGVDFVILDMEHSAVGVERIAELVRAADASGLPALVRIPDIDRALINQLLNVGAAGLVLPHATRPRCEELLRAMRYGPEGERGACQITRSAGYARGNWEDYAARANRETMAIALIEDAAALEDFDALAAIPGIDVYFAGPTDLAIALGIPGASFDDDRLGAALDRIVAATRACGKSAMTLIGNDLESDYAGRIVQRGVRMIVLGTDADLLMSAIKRLSSLKS